jgi:hypothetical protein
MSLLAAAVLIAFSLLIKILVLELGGSVALATGITLAANLAAAVIVDRAARLGGAVVLGTGVLIATVLVPMLWVPDPAEWVRENPINAFIIILAAAGWTTNGRRPRWPVLAVAGILGAAQIAVSFL